MNANKEKFKKILFQPILESVSPTDVVNQVNAAMRHWIKNNIPRSLYRYREANDYSIDTLVSDEIWGSSITTFNDPFDSYTQIDRRFAKTI